MKCAKCQTNNPENKKFCRECGADLVYLCPNCGAEVLTSDKFCGDCRHDLRKPIKTPSIDLNQPQSYTPKYLADKILTSRSSIEGERKLVTIIFADVADFTAMSEKLDPEEVHQIMDGCFKILMDEIHKYEGTINQFTGDGVMALFGAPVAHEDHAQRACHAALSIQKAIGKYGEKIMKDTGVEFRMRIGLNSGPVIVGSIGDDLRMDYTAVGDTTNLASRMESTAKPGLILVSSNTHRLVRDFFELYSHGKIEVKGKEKPQEAFELIKAGDVDTRIGASVAKGLTRFVGRKNSMGALMEAFANAKSGAGQVVGLVGEAGVGKSRLILEMRNRLPQDENIYLEGRCIHFGGSMAYLPILDILKSYFEIQEGDREYIIKKKMKDKIVGLAEKLSALLPPFQDLLSLTVDHDEFIKLEPKEKREKTFEAIRDLLVRVSEEKPLILSIEDLHWIDRTSEEFLNYLMGWLANTHILLILLYRPEYTHQWASKSYYTQIGLNQLGTASSSELIRAILEEGEVAPELKELILDRAAGNPLFIEEFTHTLLENGSIGKENEQYILNREPSEIMVPETIQGIIAARMDRLEDNIKRTMQVASVIGRDFAYRILRTITGMREELKSYLLNLQGMEFIYEKRLFPELEYIFKHALIQEVAYNSLLVKRRTEIHQQIGRAIETLYADRLEEFYEVLAYHYLKSEDLEKSYQYLKLSGDKATRNYANQGSFRFYMEAIKVLNKMPQTKENKNKQIAVRLSICLPIELLGWPEDSFQIVQDALNKAEEIGDKKNATIFSSKLSNYYFAKGEVLEAIKFSEKAFQEAENMKDVDLMVPVGSMLINPLYDISKAIEVGSKLINILGETRREFEFFGRPLNVFSITHSQIGICFGHLGNFNAGVVSCEKGLQFARHINHLPTMGNAELCYGFLFHDKGEGSSMIKHAKRCIKYCEEGGFSGFLPLADLLLGSGYYYLGELENSKKYLQKSLQMQKDIGIQLFLSFYYSNLGLIYLDLKELRTAQKYFEEFLKSSQENNEKTVEGLAWLSLGRVLGKKGTAEFGKAEGYILKGLKMLSELKIRPHFARGYLYLGDLYSDMGQKEESLKHLRKAEEMFQEMRMDYWLNRTKEVLAKVSQ